VAQKCFFVHHFANNTTLIKKVSPLRGLSAIAELLVIINRCYVKQHAQWMSRDSKVYIPPDVIPLFQIHRYDLEMQYADARCCTFQV